MHVNNDRELRSDESWQGRGEVGVGMGGQSFLHTRERAIENLRVFERRH